MAPTQLQATEAVRSRAMPTQGNQPRPLLEALQPALTQRQGGLRNVHRLTLQHCNPHNHSVLRILQIPKPDKLHRLPDPRQRPGELLLRL